MKVTHTDIPGLLVLEPKILTDQRGHFFESYNYNSIKDFFASQFLQDNESRSFRNVIRGLHYQLNPYAQAKIIRVITGRIFDIAVDLRKGSPLFGKSFGLELSGENKKQLFIPPGFAHGFSVLSDEAVIVYKCSELYQPSAERGINCFDPKLNLDWKIKPEEAVLSDKDRQLPLFETAEMNFS